MTTPRMGFSFIELVTVVALIAIISSSAAPVASSLFQRHREMVLREHLLTLRKAISQFPKNQYDDDADGETDEDPRGDANHDGFPGIRSIDDDGDLRVDEDWFNRRPFRSGGSPSVNFDWNVKRDDDEDGICDEEAYPSDLNDLTMKVPLLHKAIPVDPTLRIASWYTVIMAVDVPGGNRLANNDLDWYIDQDGDGKWYNDATLQPEDPLVVSTDAVFNYGQDLILNDVGLDMSTKDGSALKMLVDEDPRNRYDDDFDGRVDEDAADVMDVRSLNSAKGLNLSSYSEW